MPTYNILRQSSSTDGWLKVSEVVAASAEDCLAGYRKHYTVMPQNRSKDGKKNYYNLQHKTTKKMSRLYIVDSSVDKAAPKEMEEVEVEV